MRREFGGLVALVLGCVPLMAARMAAAHPAQFSTLETRVEADGRFRATLNIDILAYARMETSEMADDRSLAELLDGPRDALARQLEESNDHFRREVVIRTDVGDAVVKTWTLPGLADIDTVLARHIQPRVLVPGEIDFSGVLPAGARTLALRLPYVLGDTLHILTRPDGRTEGEPVPAGGFSGAMRLGLPTAAQPSLLLVLGRDVALGFQRIVPDGPESMLFVLGLFLLGARWRPLLWQVTAFTLSQSVTLVLLPYGVARLPASVVGSIAAASIVFISVENVLARPLRVWRLAVVILFGLAHGLGSGRVLPEPGLSREAFVTGLSGFDVGVECGQLAVLGAAFLTVGWFRHHRWYRPCVILPASIAMAVAALFWTVQRVVVGN